ncbi:unnamed protein product [Phytophthora lilii]|uniref:Unnamed protein product n=1 Tax=Phytophthora lilii TaxID=2077276 RepID=A0A9W6WQZ5_9STRA|nr:unnamed protein product [Phytophthora lilii]
MSKPDGADRITSSITPITPFAPTAEGIPAHRKSKTVKEEEDGAAKSEQVDRAGTRTLSQVQLLERDVVSLTYSKLEPLQLLSTSSPSTKRTRPAEASQAKVSLGIFLIFLTLAVTSAPLFDGSIDAEKVKDDVGSVVKKNASYAPAYFLGKGFLNAYEEAMNSGVAAVKWYPQKEDSPTNFLNLTFLKPSTYSNGVCSILDSDKPECILMTGNQGFVGAYGLCPMVPNLSVYISCKCYKPLDIGGPVAAGTWVENGRESVFIGLKKPPTCEGGKVRMRPTSVEWVVHFVLPLKVLHRSGLIR